MTPPPALLSNSYAQLPAHFYARLPPTAVAAPRLIRFNNALAEELNLPLTHLSDEELARLFAGNQALPGAEPMAMAYAGHQFGHFVPQLGDGRAILLGEVVDRNGLRRDLQLKGSGRTPYSRNGDGRAALGPVLREYIVSEAMQALGVPTTRALAAVLTGERIYREQPVAGAVLTRVAASHVRVGTYEYFAARDDQEAIRRLADYVIERHYPAARDSPRPFLALLEAVIARQASLVARWLQIGFIHGVMNTDNMAVSGETIDFGPCAFMESYDPATVFSSIDRAGRYAYANQQHAAHWNLARFAETLLPLIDSNPGKALELAGALISDYPARFAEYWLEGMRRKLGLFAPEAADPELVQGWLDAMQSGQADFTLAFRRLSARAANPAADADVRALFRDPGAYDAWVPSWQARMDREGHEPAVRAAAMRQVNPAFIPRNHRVEQAIEAAVKQEDFTVFGDLLAVLARPYDDQPEYADYARPAAPDERVTQTFCGT